MLPLLAFLTRRASHASSTGTPALPRMSLLSAALAGLGFGAGLRLLLEAVGMPIDPWSLPLAMALVAAGAQEQAQRWLGGGRLDNRVVLRTALALAQFAWALNAAHLGVLLPLTGVLIAAIHVAWSGPGAWRPILRTVVVGTVANQALLQAGLTVSALPAGVAHVAALVVLLLACIAIANIGLAWAARAAVERRLAHAAVHDPLTGLVNRNELLKRGAGLLEHASPEAPLTVLFCDLDRFKAVNDTHGHAVGDAVLVIVAERLRRCLRGEDVVGRLGGDEFVVLLPALASPQAVDEAVARIRATVSRPLAVADGPTVEVGMTIGRVTVAEAGPSIGDVLGLADAAMYRRKPASSAEASRFAIPAESAAG